MSVKTKKQKGSKNMLKKILLSLVVINLQINGNLFAASSFSDKDFEKLSNFFTLTSVHRSVSGASHLGGVLIPVGIQTSLYGSYSSSKIMKDKFGDDYSSLMQLGSVFMVGFPFSVNLELNYEPDLGRTAGKYNPSHLSYAFRWMVSDVVPIPFIAASLRFHRSTSNVDFTADFSNASTSDKSTSGKFKVESTIQGADLLVAATAIPMVEPYLGIGFVNSSTTFQVVNKDSEKYAIFTTGKAKESKDINQARILGGVEVSLALFRVGFEAELIGDHALYSLKAGLGI
jgi:hypothetical protein